MEQYDFFIAHAGADQSAAETLFDLLTRDATVFLDSKSLLLGDDWDMGLRVAQSQSRVTVVLVSPQTEAAFYQREEIAAAIQMARNSAATHRVVPVYLAPTDNVPYGLRLKHGLALAPSVSLADVAQRLIALCRSLTTETMASTEPTRAASSPPQRPDHPYGEPTVHFSDYDIVRKIAQGHYGRVYKCKPPFDGEPCILKETAQEHVSLEALAVLSAASIPNVATPRRIWVESDKVYEELPYVGGVRLSQAVVREIGGLSGSVLESFHDQLRSTLGALHSTGVIHRDIHPDNIYMVTADQSTTASGLWRWDSFGAGATAFKLAWVVVDCTFAVSVADNAQRGYRHGPYTAEEQQLGRAEPASDMYSFGATMYYAITGREVPPVERRRSDPTLPSHYPSGSHSARGFPGYLQQLLALAPDARPTTSDLLTYDSVTGGYTGALEGPDDTVIIADQFPVLTRLCRLADARRFFESPALRSDSEQARIWIDRLKKRSPA